jgi:hypothetical protein
MYECGLDTIFTLCVWETIFSLGFPSSLSLSICTLFYTQRNLTMSQHSFVNPNDVDGWNISLYPLDLHQMFRPMALIQLVSHDPAIRDHHVFKDWVSAGQAVANIKIPPQYKQPLIDTLVRLGIKVRGSRYPTALIQGNQVNTSATFVDCLGKIGVDCVRVQAYGMKMSLGMHNRLGVLTDLGNPGHPLSHLNTFDMGVNYAGEHMTLVRHGQNKIPGLKHYIVFNPISKGFGGLKMPVQYDGQTYGLKAYPRIVHQIKAQAGSHMLTKPKKVGTCRKRRTNLLRHLAEMQQLTERQLGGLRLEATVQSPTLERAWLKISQTPVLNLYEYTSPTLDAMVPYKLETMSITKEEYLQSFQELLAKAEENKVFFGRAELNAHPDSQQVIVDLFNALGWNTGRFKPTDWNDPDAWWLDCGETCSSSAEAASPAAPDSRHVLLMDKLQGIPALLRFFQMARSGVPCPLCNTSGPIFNLDGGKKQFRLQCKKCRAKLNQRESREHFVKLVLEGELTVDPDALGLDEVENAPEKAPAKEPGEPLGFSDIGDSSGSEIQPLRQSRRIRKRKAPPRSPSRVAEKRRHRSPASGATSGKCG